VWPKRARAALFKVHVQGREALGAEAEAGASESVPPAAEQLQRPGTVASRLAFELRDDEPLWTRPSAGRTSGRLVIDLAVAQTRDAGAARRKLRGAAGGAEWPPLPPLPVFSGVPDSIWGVELASAHKTAMLGPPAPPPPAPPGPPSLPLPPFAAGALLRYSVCTAGAARATGPTGAARTTVAAGAAVTGRDALPVTIVTFGRAVEVDAERAAAASACATAGAAAAAATATATAVT